MAAVLVYERVRIFWREKVLQSTDFSTRATTVSTHIFEAFLFGCRRRDVPQKLAMVLCFFPDAESGCVCPLYGTDLATPVDFLRGKRESLGWRALGMEGVFKFAFLAILRTTPSKQVDKRLTPILKSGRKKAGRSLLVEFLTLASWRLCDL